MRAYAKNGKIDSQEIRDYGVYEPDLHLENVIKARLAEGWTPEDIIEKYRDRVDKMAYIQ